MQQVAAGDGPEVQLGRRLEQQLDGGGHTLRGGADDPGAQTIEAGLQLGSQHKRGGGFRLARIADKDRAPVEAAALQPGLQEAGGRDEAALEGCREVGTDLVAAGLSGAQPPCNSTPTGPA